MHRSTLSRTYIQTHLQRQVRRLQKPRAVQVRNPAIAGVTTACQQRLRMEEIHYGGQKVQAVRTTLYIR